MNTLPPTSANHGVVTPTVATRCVPPGVPSVLQIAPPVATTTAAPDRIIPTGFTARIAYGGEIIIEGGFA